MEPPRILKGEDGMRPVEWAELQGYLMKLTELVGRNLNSIDEHMTASIVKVNERRYLMESGKGILKNVELIVTEGMEIESVIIPVHDPAGSLASAVDGLGEPVDFNIVSPPISGSGGIPVWIYKYSKCYIMYGNKVCFGIEEYDKGKRLVSVIISHD